jgi:uncharacterized protein (TIGR02118 family)
MFRVLGFLSMKDGMEMQEFVDYYEYHHVPLICSLAPTPIVYKRRYVMQEENLGSEGGAVDFDVITELAFADREAFQAWMAQLLASGKVAADEAKFLDRAKTRAYVVEEHVTSG